jgi:hypothetical protein
MRFWSSRKQTAVESNHRLLMATSTDGAIILDIDGTAGKRRTGTIFKLDALGLQMWMLLGRGKTNTEIIDIILREYRVDRETVQRDLANLIEEATRLGLPRVVPQVTVAAKTNLPEDIPSFKWYSDDTATARPDPSVSMLLAAYLGLWAFDFILSHISLAMICDIVKWWPTSRREIEDRSTLIGRICTAVDVSCIWYHKKTVCLQRSALTTCMLRVWGVSAEMVLAARPMPVMPHAWVQVNGAVVNDFPAVKTFYPVLAKY